MIVQSHLLGQILKVPKSVFDNSMKAYMPDNDFREELGSEEVVEDLSREQCLEAYRFVEEGVLEIENKLH